MNKVNVKETLIFKTTDEYKEWLVKQNWYQTIDLNNGLKTDGKQPTQLRIPHFEKFNFKDKTVLDIGCNSGQYCLMAKKLGAKKVVGLDIDENRIQQAKILAQNEGLDVEFKVAGIDALREMEQFDVVFCIAVLTEIDNALGGLKLLKKVTKDIAFIEMGLSKPVLYFSKNKRWWQNDKSISRIGRVGEFKRHKHAGWVIYPTLEIVRDIFGDEFKIEKKNYGFRYDMLHISKQN